MSTPDLTPHSVHKELKNSTGKDTFDACIIGSGIVGATYARLLVEEGLNVVVVEIGDQHTRLPAAHKKNEIVYQKNLDSFIKVIQGDLSVVSVPPSSALTPTLDPYAFGASKDMSITNNRNPQQVPSENLPGEAVTRAVGGTSTHWACTMTELLKGVERPQILTNDTNDEKEWAKLYVAGRALIGTSDQEFEHSVRNYTVQKYLKEAYTDRKSNIKSLPLACHRLSDSSPYVRWHAANNIYGDIIGDSATKGVNGKDRGFFRLLTNLACTQLYKDSGSTATDITLALAKVKDLTSESLAGSDPTASEFGIVANRYIIAAGAIAGPQLLAASGFGAIRDDNTGPITNLGTRITEQPLAFCQVVLKKDIVDYINDDSDTSKPAWLRNAVKDHKKANPDDPVPIPLQDPDPQAFIAVTSARPWFAQIHRNAFSYGEVGPKVDPRLVVDLRFFSRQDGVKTNKLLFEPAVQDAFGLPQATFQYKPTDDYAKAAHSMMNDMTDVANKLGGYLPGSEPQFMAPGVALNLGGSMSLGHDTTLSVANFNSQVWKFRNLYVGGTGTIPTAFGADPTLTSIALAIRAAYKIVESGADLSLPKDDTSLTDDDYLKWLTDPSNQYYPKHAKLAQVHKEVDPAVFRSLFKKRI